MMRSLSNAIAEADAARVENLTSQLLTLYPLIEPTLDKFPPKTVAEWQRARASKQAPMRQVEIWTTEPGTLQTDGKTLAALRAGLNRLTLPAELHRVWVSYANSTTLIRYLGTDGGQAPTLLFLPQFERVLLTYPETNGLECELECQQVLQLLANRSATDIQLRAPDGKISVFSSGNPMPNHLAFATSEPDVPHASSLRPLDFAPLGVAQLGQGRTTSGIVWGLGQLSLAALSLWQYQRVEDTRLSVAEREDAQILTNVLATSFWIAVAGSVTDALVWRLEQSTEVEP